MLPGCVGCRRQSQSWEEQQLFQEGFGGTPAPGVGETRTVGVPKSAFLRSVMPLGTHALLASLPMPQKSGEETHRPTCLKAEEQGQKLKEGKGSSLHRRFPPSLWDSRSVSSLPESQLRLSRFLPPVLLCLPQCPRIFSPCSRPGSPQDLWSRAEGQGKTHQEDSRPR